MSGRCEKDCSGDLSLEVILVGAVAQWMWMWMMSWPFGVIPAILYALVAIVAKHLFALRCDRRSKCDKSVSVPKREQIGRHKEELD